MLSAITDFFGSKLAESVVPSAISAVGSWLGGSQANAANMAQAQKQMDFQERMRATQYQTAVADMKAAGLNPMLAYTQGGAGTPTGASARVENVAGPAISNALQAAKLRAEINLLNSQASQAQAGSRSQDAQAELTLNTIPKVIQERATSAASMDQMISQAALNSVEYNRVLRVMDQIAEQMKLTQQQTENLKAELPNIILSNKKISEEIKSIIAGTGRTVNEASLRQADALIRHLQIQEWVNKNFAEQTTWGKYVRPFLPDAGQVVNSARDLIQSTKPKPIPRPSSPSNRTIINIRK